MIKLIWILGSTFAMSLIAWIGALTLALKEKVLQKVLLFLVAFSAGALLGGAFLHMMPEAVGEFTSVLSPFIWLLVGFSIFFILEQFMCWHHCHRVPSKHFTPVTYLILIADGIHNFIGGLAIAGSFLVSIETGVLTWLAAAAHEIPQEFGDFGILIRGGWEKHKALLFNFFSALTIVLGGIVAVFLSQSIDVTFLLPFAAGNFVYIATADLIPEIKHQEHAKQGIIHFVAFVMGILLLLGVKLVFES